MRKATDLAEAVTTYAVLMAAMPSGGFSAGDVSVAVSKTPQGRQIQYVSGSAV